MTDELVFQAELILKIKQKQGPAGACKKPPCCSVSSLSESEINFALPCFWASTFIPAALFLLEWCVCVCVCVCARSEVQN